jgi:hypothetical protein
MPAICGPSIETEIVSFASRSTLQVDTICSAHVRFADASSVAGVVVVVVDDVAVEELEAGDVPPLGEGPNPSPRPRPNAVRTRTPTAKSRPRMTRGYGCDFKECRRYAEFQSEVT